MALSIAARWWKVRPRKAGPPTVRAWCSMPWKSRPALLASATGSPVTAWYSVVPFPLPVTH